MKYFSSLLLVVLLFCFFSCGDKNDDPSSSNFPCNTDDLETIDDEKTCGEEEFFLICETAVAEDISWMEVEDFNWLPLHCEDVGNTIAFRNINGLEIGITISKNEHYINKERISVGCKTSIEHVSYVCQQYEYAFVEFSSSIFGSNVTEMEIYRQIGELEDGVLGDPILIFTLGQPRFGTNVYNFLYRVNVEAKYEHRSQKFFDSITLNNQVFDNVYQFAVRETYHADPHTYIYVSGKEGLFAFDVGGNVWVKE